MAIETSLASASVADAIDRVLDKGIVIDAFVRVSVLGMSVLTLELRAVVGSVDTWLKYAQAVGLAVPQPGPAKV